MSNYKIVTNDELKHYGIKGMKWNKRKKRVMLKSNYDRLWRARKRNGANSIDQFFESHSMGGTDPRVIPDPPKINNAMERNIKNLENNRNAMERRITRGDASRSKSNQGIRDRRQQLHKIRKKEYVGYRIKSDMKSYQKKAKKIIPSIKKSFNKTVSSLKTKAKTIKRRFLSGLLF